MAIPFCFLVFGGALFCAQTEPGSWQGHRADAQQKLGQPGVHHALTVPRDLHRVKPVLGIYSLPPEQWEKLT